MEMICFPDSWYKIKPTLLYDLMGHEIIFLFPNTVKPAKVKCKEHVLYYFSVYFLDRCSPIRHCDLKIL